MKKKFNFKYFFTFFFIGYLVSSEIKKIHIFIHGSFGAPENYMNKNGPNGSLKGLIRNIKEQFNTQKSVKENYDNKEKFNKRKNREKLFNENKLPLLIGKNPGLEEINFKNLTPLAFEKIYLPFKKSDFFDKNLSLREKNEKYYIFNWDGDLSKISREYSGKKLADSIKELKKKYPNAEFFCYAHSHGGNVVLEALNSDPEIKINNIFLFGMPVGKKTQAIIKNILRNCFNFIFNFYSLDDFVQTKDIFFDFPRFTKKKLESAKENVYDIELKVQKNNKNIPVQHEDFYLLVEGRRSLSAFIKYFKNFNQWFEQNKNDINKKKNLIITLKINEKENNFEFFVDNIEK